MSHNASGCNQSDRSGKGGGYGARGPRRVPRPLVVRHRRGSPPAVGNVARGGGPGPGRRRRPATDRARSPTRRLARPPPPPPQRSLTHARRAPRPATPSASAVAGLRRARLWVRAGDETGERARRAAAAVDSFRAPVTRPPGPRRRTEARRAHRRAVTEKPIPPPCPPRPEPRNRRRLARPRRVHSVGRRLDASRPPHPPTRRRGRRRHLSATVYTCHVYNISCASVLRE